MNDQVSYQEVLRMAHRLPLADKVRLIGQIAPQIQRELQAASGQPRKSLLGLWKGAGITEEEIDQARREMWGNFPRQDI
jgi:hypothetical protein